VGGGGIGVLLKLNFEQSDYANVGIIIFLITLLVAAMDFASAHIRAKLM
jgi:ABC-type phosphate/phosphonate transport system permease subunit